MVKDYRGKVYVLTAFNLEVIREMQLLLQVHSKRMLQTESPFRWNCFMVGSTFEDLQLLKRKLKTW